MKLNAGWAKAVLSHPDLLILDTETTDLKGYIVQISVLRARDGATALDTLVNPQAAIAPGAQRVHGITAEMVARAPTFGEIEPQLRALLHGRPVAVYNAQFDTDILHGELRRVAHGQPEGRQDRWEWADWWMNEVHWIDVMIPYSEWVAEESVYSGSKWQKLPGGDHTALGDCRATLAVLREMAAIGEAREEVQQQPAYIAYCRKCGGMAGACADEVGHAESVAQFVQECVSAGLIVERGTALEAVNAIWCDCGLLFAGPEAAKAVES